MNIYAFYLIIILSFGILLWYLYKWNGYVFLIIAILGILLRIAIFTYYLNAKLAVDYLGLTEFLLWMDNWHELLKEQNTLSIILYIYGEDKVVGSIGSFTHFTIFAGFIYEIFGRDNYVFPLLLTHTWLAIFTIIPLKKTIDSLLGRVIKLNWVNTFFLFNWPNWVNASTNVGRTVPSVLIVVLAFYFMVKFMNNKANILYLVCAIIAIHLTFAFRSSYIFFILSFSAFTYFRALQNKNMSLKLLGYGLFFCVLIFVVFLKFELIINELLLEAVGDKLDGQVEYGSSYLTDLYPTVYNLPYYFFIQGIYFLFAPFIWDVRSTLQLAVSIQSMIYMIYFYRLIKGLYKGYFNAKTKAFVYSILLTSFTLGLGVKNAAAADRWRLPITLPILYVSMSLSGRNRRVRELNLKD